MAFEKITVKRLLDEQGRTQVWVTQKMNLYDPEINMDTSKFSAIITGRRKLSGDELLAFCKALEVTPDEFLRPKISAQV
ncbi:MAG: helix-turn-helix transcriptional regulator [Lachnospiraceae bacterium]